jgi:hypothetical protein
MGNTHPRGIMVAPESDGPAVGEWTGKEDRPMLFVALLDAIA